MAPKNTKKPVPKKPNIRIPKDAQEKVIEITPRTFLIMIKSDSMKFVKTINQGLMKRL